MTSVSVVATTVEGREELLERSLWCYSKQTLKPEVIVALLRPKTDRTERLVKAYQDRLDVKYCEVPLTAGKFIDGYGQNKGIVKSTGDVIMVAPGSEVMFEFDAVRKAVERLDGRDKVCAMLLFIRLSESATNWLRHNPQWRHDASVLRNLVTDPINEGAYRNMASFTEDAKQMLRWIEIGASGTTATYCPVMTRDTWLWMGGFRTFDTWGTGDGDFVRRRVALGMARVEIVPSVTYHQYHPFQEFGINVQPTSYARPEDAIMEMRWEYKE